MVAHSLAFKLRPEDCCEFKVNFGYIICSRTVYKLHLSQNKKSNDLKHAKRK